VKLQLKQFNKRKIKHIQIIKQLLKLKEAVIIDEKALQKLVKKMVVQMAEIVVLKLRKNVELLNNQVVAILKILF
jgi:D-tyrosyl-tRNA(Tyr) deacylase